MRRLTPVLALVLLGSGLAACAAPATPGWTYAPAPSATPVPSGAASGSPAASPSASASAAASATPEASPSATASASQGGGGEDHLTIEAPTNAGVSGYDTKTLEGPANTAFTVTFDNQDQGVPHNFVIKKADGSKVDIGDTTPFPGVEKKDYDVPSLAPGDYPYLCEVHPTTMTGTLTIK
jgi:plastocyanin